MPKDIPSAPVGSALRRLNTISPPDAAVSGRHRGGRRQGDLNFYTIGEVAEHLDVAARTIRRWIDAGDLVAHRMGGVVRIAEADWRAFLALHRDA